MDEGAPPLAVLGLKLVAAGVLLAGLAGLGAWSLSNQPALAAEVIEPSHVSALHDQRTWLPPTPSVRAPRAAGSDSIAHPHKKKGQNKPAAPKRSPGLTEDGKVILNRASADDFTRLPGVGRKRAEAIIKLRTRLKRFRRVTDLLRVRGIGVRSLKRIRPMVVVDPPKAPAEDPAKDQAAQTPHS